MAGISIIVYTITIFVIFFFIFMHYKRNSKLVVSYLHPPFPILGKHKTQRVWNRVKSENNGVP